MDGYLVKEEELEGLVEHRHRPVGVEVSPLRQVVEHEVEGDGFRHVGGDEGGEDGEFCCAAPLPEDKKQQQMAQERGRPNEEIEAGHVHSLSLRLGDPRGSIVV